MMLSSEAEEISYKNYKNPCTTTRILIMFTIASNKSFNDVKYFWLSCSPYMG